MKSRYYDLAKDLLLFALSTFIPKAITFFLVPLYTNCLSTAEYGIVDMVVTTISILVPILTLGASDAVLRFTIDNKENRNALAFANQMTLCAAAVVIGAVFFNKVFGFLQITNALSILFVLQFFLTALYGIGISYLRATEKVILLAATSIINTITLVTCNIVFLVKLKLGINGYLLSNVLALAVVNVIIGLAIRYPKIVWHCHVEVQEKKAMITYSAPLIASNLAWWVNSASDRYFISYLLGLEQNGIYSISYKIPTVLQLLQSVFSQAWLLSVYREYQKKDGCEYIAKIYDLYNSAMCLACAGLILLDIPLARFLYAKEFFEAWKYVPALLISVVFIASAGFFETIITLFKKSNVVAATTIAGAVVNLLLNFLLITSLGTMGAAIATAVSYAVMFAFRMVYVKRVYPISIRWTKHFVSWALLIIDAVCMVCWKSAAVSLVIIAVLCVMNFPLLRGALQKRNFLQK